MAVPKLIIAGREILPHSGRIVETVTAVDAGSTVRRTRSGNAVKSTHFVKYTGVISGSGFIPSGLSSIDYSLPILLKSTKLENDTGETNVFDLVGTLRDDFTPEGYALLDGMLISTPVTMSGNEATLDLVSGATRYEVRYFREYTIFAVPPEQSQDTSHDWLLTWSEA